MENNDPEKKDVDEEKDSDLVICNGIDPETGNYAVPPTTIEDLAKLVFARPGVREYKQIYEEATRSFAAPFGTSLDRVDQVGWGIVFAEGTSKEIEDALAPLIERRRSTVGDLLKILDYKTGETTAEWYRRQGVAPGNFEPELVPYYLLLVGPPTSIPFEFQYLLGIEYAVGRLVFDTPAEYASYVKSVVSYETATTIKNAKEIVYWGTCHPGDDATNLSSNYLIDPLVNGINDPAVPSLKKPVHQKAGYSHKRFGPDDATRANLLGTLQSGKPPALLFTASHGLWPKAGSDHQEEIQGGLLCQDWPGFGSYRPEHSLKAADIPDDADVSGMIAFVFACFGAGTPDNDQFVRDLNDPTKALKLASEPFIAALPRRLLAHPNGGALAFIGHIDRAWGFSIKPVKFSTPQIRTFINTLEFTLGGVPVGYAVQANFGGRYSTLSTDLLSVISPTAGAGPRLSDRELVNYWIERNDAQNYLILGDPAVQIRKDLLNA